MHKFAHSGRKFHSISYALDLCDMNCKTKSRIYLLVSKRLNPVNVGNNAIYRKE